MGTCSSTKYQYKKKDIYYINQNYRKYNQEIDNNEHKRMNSFSHVKNNYIEEKEKSLNYQDNSRVNQNGYNKNEPNLNSNNLNNKKVNNNDNSDMIYHKKKKK